ncbi:hypothetical protein, partial [Romboutsia sp.]|uniref:hypothetical protein n=1 Tax=Romboutsia sp. TaxID=1965302 RepID=UPI002C7524DF
TMFLATEVGIDDSIGKFFAQMEGIRTNINTNTNKKSKLKVVEVHVNINEFRDATEIKVDTKVPMSELKMIITKARQDILDNVREIRYSEKGEMWIGHKKGSKDVVINIEGWKMSESENLIFIENFLEYITE